MKEFYSEVKCNYLNDEGYWCVDAWRTGDGDEEGKVVAVINDKTGDVFYCEPEARLSPMVADAVKQRKELIERNVYAVIRERHCDNGSYSLIVCGIYDSKIKACKRLRKVYDKNEQQFKRKYSQNLVDLNCKKMAAELHFGDGFVEYDDVYIKVIKIEINKPVYKKIL